MKKLLRKLNDWMFPEDKVIKAWEKGYDTLPEGKYSIEDVEQG